MGSPKKFKTAVLGGTFDHFHKGHRSFLNHGISVSERLVVGITSDKYLKKFKIQNSKFKIPTQSLKVFESFRIRQRSVEKYLKKNVPDRYEIVKIDDMYGTTLNKDFQAEIIVVSEFTKGGAEEINRKRKEEGLKEFKILVCPEVLAQDGKPISSFRIRKGEVNREGKLYINPLWISQDLILPPKLRAELRFPLGKLFKKIEDSDSKNNFLITVGDETTKIFHNASIYPNIAVIDYKVARKKKYKNLKELGFLGNERVYSVINQAGLLSKDLFKLASDIFLDITSKDHIIIQIDGEDDLSVLPLILASPLGASIFYGQAGEGIVEVHIDEETKAKARFLLSRFITRGY